jgi:hypothetical protein
VKNKNIECKKIMNGKACTIENNSELNEIISARNLTGTVEKFKNGNRAFLTGTDGTWKMTALRYAGSKKITIIEPDP